MNRHSFSFGSISGISTRVTPKPQSGRAMKLSHVAVCAFLTLGLWYPGAQAQTREWVWAGGSSTIPAADEGQIGVFGTLGVAAKTNIPGARNSASSWVDKSGNFWLFGGSGEITSPYGCSFQSVLGPCYLNDLWEFNPATNEWTWMSGSNTSQESGVYGSLGVPAVFNVPGGRYGASSWVDKSGNFWIFGGMGLVSTSGLGQVGPLNDLWEFNPSTGEWTWASGSGTGNAVAAYGTMGVPAAANVPGGRQGANAWTDSSGNLWLFGGDGVDSAGNSGSLNDLWKFNPSDSEWTWISGSTTVNAVPSYGTMGVSAATNVPGARQYASAWTDGSGNLWFFGGDEGTTTQSEFNDVWEFSPSTNQWVWMGGSTTSNESATYGTMGVAAATNLPGGREASINWVDSRGNVWFFGGVGLNSAGGVGRLNDLWEFTPSTSEWTWMGGSTAFDGSTGGNPGTYGTLGTAAAANIPGSRGSAANWVDGSGNFWLFGGNGFDSATDGLSGVLNDLWEYPAAKGSFALAATAVTVAPGSSGTSTITVSSTTGYTGTISLTCAVTGSPSGANALPTCSASSSITLSSSTSSGTATVTVSTTAASSSALTQRELGHGKQWAGAGGGAVLALMFFLVTPTRRRAGQSLSGILLLTALLGALSSCGSGGAPRTTGTGTTPGAYTLTVTGTGNDSANTVSTTTFTLTVN